MNNILKKSFSKFYQVPIFLIFVKSQKYPTSKRKHRKIHVNFYPLGTNANHLQPTNYFVICKTVKKKNEILRCNFG
jgi:hypothetical protein